MTPAERIPRLVDTRSSESLRGVRRVAQHQTMRSAAVLEREIERLTARVAEVEREKADVEAFAAIAAHELVEPLVMTEAYAAMVSDRLDERQHADSLRDLDALGRGAARLRRLIETLLHDARSSGRALRLRPVDLNAMVRDCVALLRPDFAARNIGVEVGDLPEVIGDEALLSGVFSNLLINGLKYSPRQGSTIRVFAAREAGVWRISVESEGPTVPVEDRERIFEPYHRGRDERRAHGSGLGLTICKRIVARHGGEIGVTAANGSGNRFYFTLPA